MECPLRHRNRLAAYGSFKVYINNSLHLGRKYARIFVRGHYLFLVAHSFPRATLSENCSLLGTDNVRGQISEHIFAPNGGYCLYYPSNLLRNTRSFENWGISSDIPQFQLGNIRPRDAFRPIARERKYLMDYKSCYHYHYHYRYRYHCRYRYR